ncbi:CD226 antigen [Elgaria multicarinata webbii]|uniref:CD226 antigen n=1 Tax=Elgaria multicarinata webbii TaxID=159646 RepID=UPI002FCD03C9
MWPGNSRHLHEVLSHVFLGLLEMDYYLAVFIIAVLQSYKSCVSVTVKRKYVDSTVKLVHAMTLECVYPKTANVSQMSWIKEKGNNKVNIVVFKLPHLLYIKDQYKLRVRVSNDTTNNKSLVFSNVIEEDTGFYVCSFQTFPFGHWEKRIEVVQSEVDTLEPNLIPAAVPQSHYLQGDFEPQVSSNHQIFAEPGESVTFTHTFDSDIVVNQVIWERIQVDCMDFIVQCDNSNMLICGSDYQDRVEMDCATETNSTIVLHNITVSDSGMYRCFYTGRNGKNATGWIKLTVGGSGSVTSVFKDHLYYIVGAATSLLIVILVIVGTILHYKKKKRKRATMMEICYTSQIQPSQRCRKSCCCSKGNASRDQNTTKSETPDTQFYINCRGFSRKQNMQV